jgi:hypothetical protein
VAKVALRFGCAKQSKHLERYLVLIASYWPFNFSYSDVMMQQLPNVDPSTVLESRKLNFKASQ